MGALLRSEPVNDWRGTAFGLELAAGFPAAGLDDLAATPTGSPVSLGLMAAGQLRALWRPLEARTVVNQQVPAMTLEEHPALGYLLATADFGSYLLSRDGSTVRCAPAGEEHWRWQRFLTGQVLPLAALLRGFEVFHSSAVRLDGRAIAFIGPAGAGKSSIALQLLLMGARLITDDVLTLRVEDGRLIAHPGAGVLNLRHAEHELLVEAGVALGPELGRDQKGVRLMIERQEEPLPLDAVFFLNRWGSDPGARFERVTDADPARLLAATFNFAIRAPERLLNQLDVCSRLATSVELYEVSCPPTMGAAALAAEIVAQPS